MDNEKICCVIRGPDEKPVQKAVEELVSELQKQGASPVLRRYWEMDDAAHPLLIIGDMREPLVDRVITENRIVLSPGPEMACIQSCRIDGGKKALLVTACDAAGLMYGIYELADRIRCEGLAVLAEDIHIEEHPENQVRGVDRYLMNHLDEEWFYSLEFWQDFLKKLARNRFNRFTLITGFDTSYFSPPYPFLVEVPGFPSVRVKGLSPEKRSRNLEALRGIAAACGDYGILFSFGAWQQMPWTKNQEMLVENIPAADEEFTRYCSLGIKTLLEKCPGIAALQFRVNMEAGITKPGGGATSGAESGATNTHETFWNAMTDAVAGAAGGAGRTVKLDLRAKGVTDGMISHALVKGLDVSVPTKYWCEHAALPYHISKLRSEESRNLKDMNSSRRYSYSDLLKRPHWYHMIYRLWNYGSINLFLWGDPDYGRRFSRSLRMGDGAGFEINSPLSLKGGMENLADKPWNIHRDPALINYRREDDRYWAYYLVFGRCGYSSGTGREIFLREFSCRFGKDGAALLEAYEWAGKIIPLITAIHFPVHPSLHYWPELYPGAAIFAKNNYDFLFGCVDYASALPGDEELFCSIAEYAEGEQGSAPPVKYSPLLMRGQLRHFAEMVRTLLKQSGCRADADGEKRAVWVDFTMLALIADFHVWKIPAAYYLYRYKKNPLRADLIAAYRAFREAYRFWEELADMGSRYYHHDLQFNAGTGAGRHKNWQERLEKEVRADLLDLEKLLREAGEDPEKFVSNEREPYYPLVPASTVKISGAVPETWYSNKDLTISVCVEGVEKGKVFLNYRRADHTEGEYQHISMVHRGGEYSAVIPGDYFARGYDVIVYISALDDERRAAIYPGINHPQYDAPYFVIKTGMAENA